MLDDTANLAPVWRWLEGEIGWRQVVFENGSGPLGRPISMLSFLGTAAAFGQSAAAFKAVNLAIHLLIGALIFLTLTMLLRRDRVLGVHAAWSALAITAIWLLHPLFASTVLYVVQRMAMLSALFVVMGLGVFVWARSRIEAGNTRSGIAGLFIGVPAMTVLAAFSKETGLLLPLLCGVLEWAYFAPIADKRRARPAHVFLWLFVAAPVVAGSLYLLANPDFFLAGYENRPFTAWERLLTQSRVLFDYVGSLMLPSGREFSLYRDDYVVSTSMLQPVTTLLALVGWLVLAGLAVALRRVIPAFSAGIGLFLVGHAMESSIFSLMIYFEHRNYLPGLGIIMAAIGVLGYLGRELQSRMDRPGIVFGGALVGLLAALSFATYARALSWQSPRTLLEQAVEQYPDSRHARMELVSIIMNGPFPDRQVALQHYRHLQGLDLPSTRSIGYLGEIAVSCFASNATNPENLELAFAQQPETIQADYLKTVESVGRLLRQRECEGVSATALADRLVQVVEKTHLSQSKQLVWRLRFEAARLYANEEQNRKALRQAERIWEQDTSELPVGMLLAALHIRLGQLGAANELLDAIAPRIPESDETGQSLLRDYQESIEEGHESSPFQWEPNDWK